MTDFYYLTTTYANLFDTSFNLMIFWYTGF